MNIFGCVILQLMMENGEENALLNVPIASRDDIGKYTACLKNEFGEDEGDINVVVLGELVVHVHVHVFLLIPTSNYLILNYHNVCR